MAALPAPVSGRRDELAEKVRTVFIGLVGFQMFVSGLCALAATSWAQGTLAFGLNFTLAGASGLVGGLLGFVFGIPRALSDGPDTANGGAKANTNLEQISDWLTKIVVGASLASLAALPSAFAGLIDQLDGGIYKHLPGGGYLAAFTIVFYVALGFFWSYVETRTLITELFAGYAAGLPVDALMVARTAPWQPGSAPIPEDKLILALNPKSLDTPMLLEARAGAATRASDFTAARDAYKAAIGLDPGNPFLPAKLSAVLARLGDTKAADSLIGPLARAALGNTPRQEEVQAQQVGNALYKDPPAGFKEAIETGEPLLGGSQATNAWLHLWLACAYAQRYAYARTKGQTPDEGDRSGSLTRLRDALRLRPELRDLALRLWKPAKYGGDRDENDLEVFADDSDFAGVLGSVLTA